MRVWRGFVIGALLLVGSLALCQFAAGPDPFGRFSLVGAEVIADPASSDRPRSLAADHAPKQRTKTDTEVRVVGFGHVDIETGTTPLSVPALGQVDEVLVRDGEKVTAGQPLVRLARAQSTAMVERADAVVREAEVRLAQARRVPENHRLLIEKQEQAITADKSRLEGHRRQVDRLKKLSEQDATPMENYLSARDKLDELEAALKAGELQLLQLRLEDPNEGIMLAESALAAAKAQRAMVQDELNRHTLHAPENGTVLRVLVAKGQMLGPNQQGPALWFCTDRPRVVRCEIDQEFANRVAVGMPAKLFDDNQSEHPWIGRVTRCADWIGPRRSLLDEPFQRNDVRTLECIIELDPDQPPLRIGQRLRVEILEAATLAAPEKLSAR